MDGGAVTPNGSSREPQTASDWESAYYYYYYYYYYYDYYVLLLLRRPLLHGEVPAALGGHLHQALQEPLALLRLEALSCCIIAYNI